jgi:hypothetical protein
LKAIGNSEQVGYRIQCYGGNRDGINEMRMHLSLDKDTPILRGIEAAGRIFARPVLGGLHHQYVRI